MKRNKILSLILALALVLSAAAATAESAETPAETALADDGTQTAETVYTLDEMLTQSMRDAYQRQAAYAAYAEAFPDSRSITGINMDTQIVLLEMLLKANGTALPSADAQAAVPETKADAYAAIAEAESNALTLYRAFLSQEDLAADARIIFRTVAQQIKTNAAAFQQKVRSAQRVERVQELLNDEDAQIYVINNEHGRGTRIVYVVTNTTAGPDAQETAEPAAEDGTSN